MNQIKTTNQTVNQKQQIKAAIQLSIGILLIFLGFATDGITEWGHHACFIAAGLVMGIWIGRTTNHETNNKNH